MAGYDPPAITDLLAGRVHRGGGRGRGYATAILTDTRPESMTCMNKGEVMTDIDIA